MSLSKKIISWERLPEWRAGLRDKGVSLVVTNGCFDLIHLGHVTYLEGARNLGQALLVGVNGDDSVRQLKGEGRPMNNENDRAGVVAALESVSAVCIFEDKSAASFLARAEPDVYVKGGDYTLDSINQEERRIVEKAGGRIVIVPFLKGRSTSSLLKKIAAQ